MLGVSALKMLPGISQDEKPQNIALFKESRKGINIKVECAFAVVPTIIPSMITSMLLPQSVMARKGEL